MGGGDAHLGTPTAREGQPVPLDTVVCVGVENDVRCRVIRIGVHRIGPVEPARRREPKSRASKPTIRGDRLIPGNNPMFGMPSRHFRRSFARYSHKGRIFTRVDTGTSDSTADAGERGRRQPLDRDVDDGMGEWVAADSRPSSAGTGGDPARRRPRTAPPARVGVVRVRGVLRRPAGVARARATKTDYRAREPKPVCLRQLPQRLARLAAGGRLPRPHLPALARELTVYSLTATAITLSTRSRPATGSHSDGSPAGSSSSG